LNPDGVRQPTDILKSILTSAPKFSLSQKHKMFCAIKGLCIFATNQLQIKKTKMRRDIFQAIADPTRRAIISLIVLQAMTPNALAEKFDSSRQAVSKHIQILDECGLVTTKQVGRERYYQINPKKLKEVADWIEPFRQMWENKFDQLDNVLLKLRTKKKTK
jgi:DNA-binding transcriptional ArsR family regulator